MTAAMTAAEGDIHIRRVGRAGRITLTRPRALNAVTWAMCTAIETALDAWRDDDGVDLVVIDAEGARAFSAGGDIADLYARGRDASYSRRFWAEEYRLNARISEYPKPFVAFLQGFTMGGGVGISCHGTHRIVGDTSRIAMPECAIGLIPDVGGTALLARAPGRLGEYLGVTGARMGPGDAIHAGFATHYRPEVDWPGLIAALEAEGDTAALDGAAPPEASPGAAPEAPLAARADWIARHFNGATMGDVLRSLAAEDSPEARDALALIRPACPLSVACTYAAVGRVRGALPPTGIRPALEMEYRFTARAVEEGDILEGIRAAIIDKDRAPRWSHARVEDVTLAEVSAMLRPLPASPLHFDKPV